MFDKARFESEVKSAIKIDDADFDYEGYDCCEDSGNIFVSVDLKSLKEAWDNWHKAKTSFDGHCSVILRSRVPKLIPANLGDMVLVFDNYARHEGDLDVGIVTSVHETPQGACYGCRHIVIKTLGSRAGQLWGLSEEDYGGYPVGFYKVLSREEGVALAAEKIKSEILKHADYLREEADALSPDISRELDDLVKIQPTTSRLIGSVKVWPNSYK